MELGNELISDSDDEEQHNEIIIEDDKLDIDHFNLNYNEMKKKYKTSTFLNKYEMTNVLSKRSEQLAQGSQPFLKNPEIYSSVYEIAQEELRQNKIPFIIRRPISGYFEYWKLEDLKSPY